MKIAVIQAKSQVNKNKMIFDAVGKYAGGSELYNFGCTEKDRQAFSQNRSGRDMTALTDWIIQVEWKKQIRTKITV